MSAPKEGRYEPYPVPSEPYGTDGPLFDADEPNLNVKEKPKPKKPKK